MLRQRSLITLAFIIPILFYFKNIAPSLVGNDGDEYLLQAYQLGIAHPCGYPLYLLIGKIALVLTHNRLNTMSIVSFIFSASALFLLYMLVRSMKIRRMPAAAAVMMFAFTPLFWKFAPQAEVYNVNAFFLILLLLLAYRWNENPSRALLCLTGLVFGLSLGIYFANILLFPAFVALFLMHKNTQGRTQGNVRNLVLFLVSFLAGAIPPFVYLYVRAQAIPPLGTLYYPDSFRNFLFYISGRQYATMHFNGFSFFARRLLLYAAILILSFCGIGAVFAAKGLKYLTKKNRHYAAFLILAFLGTFLYFAHYQAPDSYTMISLCFIITAVLMSVGLDEAYQRHYAPKPLAFAFTFAVLVLFQIRVFPSVFRLYRNDLSVYNTCTENLRSLPPDAVLFTTWDYVSSYKCLQTIQKQRQDILVYESISEPRHYREDGRILTIPDYETYARQILQRTERPVFITHDDTRMRRTFRLIRVKHGLYRIENS